MAQQSLTSVLGPAKFNLWYETIIDYVIANPEIKQGEIARRLGRSQPWVSLVMNSDSFKARYAKRREEHSRRISEGVESRLHGVATQALDRLAETLKKKDLTPAFTLDATDILLTRLGYTALGKNRNGAAEGGGAPPGTPGGVTVQVFQPIPLGTLNRAQAEIRSIEATKLDEITSPVASSRQVPQANATRLETEEAQIVNEEDEVSDPAIREDSATA